MRPIIPADPAAAGLPPQARTGRPRLLAVVLLALALGGAASAARAQEKALPPIKALLVTGGCCHNYPFQSQALTEAVTAGSPAPVIWTVVNEGGRGTEAEIDLYNTPDWARPYEVVVHNECFANTTNPEYIRRITKAHHEGVPAVVIHCAMHTYRAAQIDDWREFLGVTSRRHDHQSHYEVKPTDRSHPVMKGFPETWTTPMDELYVIEKLWPKARALATSTSERDGQSHAVFWINQYGKARVFGTTYGHSDATFRDPVFLQTLTRGLLWACGRLPEEAE